MKNYIKLKLIISAFLILFVSHSFGDQILPLPKPSVDKETKTKTAKKKQIYPQKKPTAKKENGVQKLEGKVDKTDKKESVFIYPEKKPVIVKKKIDKPSIKSIVLSKKDFKIAKSAFGYIDKKNGKQH